MKHINLQRRLGFWQRRLRLLDWDITVAWAPELECTSEHSAYREGPDVKIMAGVNTDAISKEARIFLRLDGWDDAAEQERALVHELLHVVLLEMTEAQGFKPRLVALERTINHLTRVLCAS